MSRNLAFSGFIDTWSGLKEIVEAKSVYDFKPRIDGMRYGNRILQLWLTSCILQLGKYAHIDGKFRGGVMKAVKKDMVVGK